MWYQKVFAMQKWGGVNEISHLLHRDRDSLRSGASHDTHRAYQLKAEASQLQHHNHGIGICLCMIGGKIIDSSLEARGGLLWWTRKESTTYSAKGGYHEDERPTRDPDGLDKVDRPLGVLAVVRTLLQLAYSPNSRLSRTNIRQYRWRGAQFWPQ